MSDNICSALVLYCDLEYIADLRQAINKEDICFAIRIFLRADDTRTLWAWNYVLTFIFEEKID